ncbi:transporter [Chryseobacterium piperi]|uniref:Transporter n=1 Tax=Chryseobacterium piperi TaxID=558152 RepID=A0A086AHP5_9FLAO|nr:potassium channel family protein [Chryseobacterium piperi]ASW73901.1 transporter [Chryseobacterium piperi]KFF16209.1 transporter [Chryseobacterium piperi]
MKKALEKFQTFWLEDLSFVVLLLMLFLVVFITPVIMDNSKEGILLYNTILLSVFFSGIFSTRNKWMMLISGSLFMIHCILRLVRFSDNPFSFYVLENVIAILNTIVFITINVRLLFRDDSVNMYRIIGGVNVYLLLALMGALAFEIINAVTGVSIAGPITLTGSDQDYVHFIYFSLVSLTTVGFGDIHPVSVETKMLSVFLSMLGILFPAVIIAKLVGLSANSSKKID